ncbi:hypothetical protein [Clostridium sp.]|uniref:hypothetical protein n=1 Tax=Clostridium sp. TaxID=1506 RepID=UPI0035A03447
MLVLGNFAIFLGVVRRKFTVNANIKIPGNWNDMELKRYVQRKPKISMLYLIKNMWIFKQKKDLQLQEYIKISRRNSDIVKVMML